MNSTQAAKTVELGTRHPELDQLISYHEGRIPEEDRATLQDHLVTCERCAERILDLCDFETAPESVPETELEAAREVARRIWERTRVTPYRTSWASIAAAAGLAAGLMGFFVGRTTVTQTASLEPTFDLPVFEIVGEPMRGASDHHEVAVATGAQFVVLSIHPRTSETFDDYRVRILDLESGKLWSQGSARADAWGTIHVGLPLAGVAPKPAEVIVEGLRGRESTSLMRVILRFSAESSPG